MCFSPLVSLALFVIFPSDLSLFDYLYFYLVTFNVVKNNCTGEILLKRSFWSICGTASVTKTFSLKKRVKTLATFFPRFSHDESSSGLAGGLGGHSVSARHVPVRGRPHPHHGPEDAKLATGERRDLPLPPGQARQVGVSAAHSILKALL